MDPIAILALLLVSAGAVYFFVCPQSSVKKPPPDELAPPCPPAGVGTVGISGYAHLPNSDEIRDARRRRVDRHSHLLPFLMITENSKDRATVYTGEAEAFWENGLDPIDIAVLCDSSGLLPFGGRLELGENTFRLTVYHD